MKLSDFLMGVGRPVAFYPGLVKALGDRNETIFICQMAYWRGKGEESDGWIYKTSEEIETETSLTYKEQTNVRDGLKDKSLLEEYYARTEHKMYFRVNWDSVNEIWEQFTNGHMPDGKVLTEHITKGKVAPSQRSGGSLPTVISLNSNTETTHKTTTETTAAACENLAWLSKKYTEVIGLIANIKIADELKDHADHPLPWLEYAFQELAAKNAKEPVRQKWSYVKAVLKTCRENNGIPTSADKPKGKAAAALSYLAGVQ